ncbi:phosphopantetheine-binding protein [Streptomyces sp. NBC_01210]|uniref:phosphopantetheine-binding protein n=1 Tax=Streptomyces sp. NBC_01210 TaxID=2903774 RepID=UPI002E0D3576|nr:phosphopantetheine-binding protein [Streptomyces sp. NBC_01210]
MVNGAAHEAVNSVGRICRLVGEEMGDILTCPPLAPDEDFLAAGGDSLHAVELVSRLVARWQPAEGDAADRLQAALVTAVFDDPSPGRLAAVIVAGGTPLAP